jgi:hypothetical protein
MKGEQLPQEDRPPLDAARLARFFQGVRTALAGYLSEVEQRVKRYIASLRTHLERAREQIRQHNLHHADAFTVFDYIEPDENCLSDILADLLNPRGPHGQGDCFLQLFMRTMGVPLPCDSQRVTITREERTRFLPNPLRRIDVLLDFDTFGIGIENKPWAEEQPDQVKDYLDHLRRRYGEAFLLVYLSGDGSAPPSVPFVELVRLKERKQFRLVAYPIELCLWVDDCVKNCQAEKVRWFLRDLASYLRRWFSRAVED